MGFTDKYDVISVTLDINDFCNMKCSYCWEQQQKNRLDRNTAEIICDRLVSNFNRHKKSSALRINFFGGEPLIDWLIIKFVINNLKDRIPTWFGITTNATLITDEIIEEFKSCSMNVMVSLDGKKKRHDASRKFIGGKPTYERVVQSLRKIQEANLPYEVRMTVLPKHAKYLAEDITHLVEDLGIRQIAPVPVYDRKWSEKQLKDFENAIKDTYDLYVKYHFDYKDKVYIKYFEDFLYKDLDVNHKLSPCGFGSMLSISIDTKGNIYPCHQLPTRKDKEKFIIGNILTDETYENDLVKCISPNSFKSKLCGECPAKNKICSGGCLMESYEENGDLLSPTEITCRFNKLYYEVFKQIQSERRIPAPISPSERRDFLYSSIMRLLGNIRDAIRDNGDKEYDCKSMAILSEVMWTINEQIMNNKAIHLGTPDLMNEIHEVSNLIRSEVLKENA